MKPLIRPLGLRFQWWELYLGCNSFQFESFGIVSKIFESIRSLIFWKYTVSVLTVLKIIPRHQTFMMKGLCQVMKLTWLFHFFLSLEFQLKDRFLSLQGPFTFHFNLCWYPSYSSLWGNWGNRFDKFRNHPNDISFSRWVDFDTSPFLKSSKIPMGQIYRGPLYTLPNLNCISCIHCPVFYFIIPFGYFTG